MVVSYREVANGLAANTALREWGIRDLEIWLRDGCSCVYCNKDMLQCYEISRLEYEYDHLLPRCQYPELDVTWDDHEWKTDAEWKTRNIVLACRTCNRIKLQHDVNTWNFEGVKQTPIYQKGQILTYEEWRELIKRVKNFIQKKKQANSERFARERELILGALALHVS